MTHAFKLKNEIQGGEAVGVYTCKKCGVVFSHYHKDNLNIRDAFKKSGIPEECKNVTNTSKETQSGKTPETQTGKSAKQKSKRS